MSWWEPWCTFLGLAFTAAGFTITIKNYVRTKNIQKMIIPEARRRQFIKERVEYREVISSSIRYFEMYNLNKIPDYRAVVGKTFQTLSKVNDVLDLFPEKDKKVISSATQTVDKLFRVEYQNTVEIEALSIQIVKDLCNVLTILERDELI